MTPCTQTLVLVCGMACATQGSGEKHEFMSQKSWFASWLCLLLVVSIQASHPTCIVLRIKSGKVWDNVCQASNTVAQIKAMKMYHYLFGLIFGNKFGFDTNLCGLLTCVPFGDDSLFEFQFLICKMGRTCTWYDVTIKWDNRGLSPHHTQRKVILVGLAAWPSS